MGLTVISRKLFACEGACLFVHAKCFMMHGLLLYLPTDFESLRLTNGTWNWSGKIFAFLGSLLFLSLYRKFALKDYFLTFKQNKGFLKHGVTGN